MNTEENNLVIDFNKGSKIAFDAIYLKLYSQVFLFVKTILSGSDEAQDITADTFVKLWKLRGQFETFANIRAFLFITARNACLDYLRHQKMKAEKLREIYQGLDKEEKIISRDEIESEAIEWVRTKIPTLLTSREAKIIELAYFGGYKNSEIAEMLNINEKTLRNLKTLALNKIKAAILNQNLKNGLIALTAMALYSFGGLVIFC